MPRKILIRSDSFPYHVTNRTRDKSFYSLSLGEVWGVYADQLRIATWAFGASIHAFVLMSNHYHLLMSTPENNIDQIIRFVQSEVSKELVYRSRTKTSSFDTRYRWSLIREKNYFFNVYRYIYQNPLRAGIANSVSDYRYSTFHGRAGYSRLLVPITHHPFFEENLFESYVDEEIWLNETLPQEQIELIRKGVRRYEFALPERERAKLQHFM